MAIELTGARHTDQHRGPRPGPRRGRRRARRHLLPDRGGQDQRLGVPERQLLLVDGPRLVDLRRRAALADVVGRPRAQPGGGAAQGHLQLVDGQVRPLHAHRLVLVRRGQGRGCDGRLGVRVVRVPGQLAAAGVPEPGYRAVPG